MVDIQEEIQKKQALFESKRPKHVFNDDSLTFKQLRDIFSDTFGQNIVSVSRKVPMKAMYVTCKDGDFYVAKAETPKKLLKVTCVPEVLSLDEADADKPKSTVNKVIQALSGLDIKDLNRIFANGKNLVKVSILCPSCATGKLYGDDCFLTIDGIDCFNDKFTKSQPDPETAKELADLLEADGQFADVVESIPAEKLECFKRCCNEKKVLEALDKALKKFVDGIGWGCTLNDYISDRYARCIINKALNYGVDASKNGNFVYELASRLCGTSNSRPTKSDLMTFAKRDGIDCKSEGYAKFLEDVESSALTTADAIVAPIECMIWYALSKAATNAIGFMSLDNNPKAQKLLRLAQPQLFATSDDMTQCQFDFSKADAVKKGLRHILEYLADAPSEIYIIVNSKPYVVKNNIKSLEKLAQVAC